MHTHVEDIHTDVLCNIIYARIYAGLRYTNTDLLCNAYIYIYIYVCMI